MVEFRNHSSRLKRAQGSVALLFIALWTPIVALILVAMNILNQGLHYAQKQKVVDRCVFQIMTQRCNNLTSLSQSNKKLDRLINAAYAARALQVIPALTASAKTTEMNLRVAAQALQQYQDGLIKLDAFLGAGMIRCGLFGKSDLITATQVVTRPPHASAAAIGFPSLLTLDTELSAEVTGWNGQTCFARCTTDGILALKGESYFVSFTVQNKNRPLQDKSYSKPLSSLFSWF